MRHSIIGKLTGNSLGTGLHFFLRWAILFVFSRLLPLDQFGWYSSMNAGANLLTTFFTFGSTLHLVKTVAESPATALPRLHQSDTLTLLLFTTTLGAAAAGLLLPPAGVDFIPVLTAAPLALAAALARNNIAYWKGHGDFFMEVKAYLAAACSGTACLVLLLLCTDSFSLPHALTTAVVTFYAPLLLLARKTGAPNRKNWRWRPFLRQRLPYGLHEALAVTGGNLPVLIISALGSYHEVGVFQSIALLFVPATIFPMLHSQVLLQMISSRQTSWRKRRRIFRRFQYGSFLAGLVVVVAIVAAFLAMEALRLAPSAGIKITEHKTLVLLMLGNLFLRFISANYGMLLTKMDRQTFRVITGMGAIAAQLIISWALYDRLGIAGVAAGQCCGTMTLLAAYAWRGEASLRRGEAP